MEKIYLLMTKTLDHGFQHCINIKEELKMSSKRNQGSADYWKNYRETTGMPNELENYREYQMQYQRIWREREENKKYYCIRRNWKKEVEAGTTTLTFREYYEQHKNEEIKVNKYKKRLNVVTKKIGSKNCRILFPEPLEHFKNLPMSANYEPLEEK